MHNNRMYLDDKIAYASIFEQGTKRPERFNDNFPQVALLSDPQDLIITQGNAYSELTDQRPLLGKDSRINCLQVPVPEGSWTGSYAEYLLSNDKVMDELARKTKRGHITELVPSALSFAATVLAKELKLNCHMLSPEEVDCPPGIYPKQEYFNNSNIRTLNSKAQFTCLSEFLDAQEDTNYTPSTYVVHTPDQLVEAVDALGQSGQEVLLKQDISMGGEGNYLLTKEDVAELAKRDYPQRLAYLQSIVAGRGLNLREKVLVQEYFNNVLLNPSFEYYCAPGQEPQFVYGCQMNIDEDLSYQGATIPDIYSGFKFQKAEAGLKGREKEYRHLVEKVKQRAKTIASCYQENGFSGICDFDTIFFIKDRKLETRFVEMNAGRETGATLDYYLLQLLGKQLNTNLLGRTGSIQNEDGDLVLSNIVQRTDNMRKSGTIITDYNGTSRIETLDYRRLDSVMVN